MISIPVCVSGKYEVKVGQGLLCRLGAEIAAVVKGRTAVIISDDNVWPLYGDSAVASLEKAGFLTHSWIISAGESSKNSDNYIQLLTFLAQNHITRTDCLVALGGGVVGDLTGFAAATYLRGIPYIQVPTSLLAMVDSSVGGKTAINLAAGKNLAGAFYQPKLVLCDTDTLITLPKREFLNGSAEIIKYGVLFDPSLFAQLEAVGPAFEQESVIARCIDLKKQTVTEDEFDTGIRRLLNLGHTLGHSIEMLTDFKILHGEAVSIGMSMIARCAAAHGQCSDTDRDRFIALLAQFGLPTGTDLPIEAIIQQATGDKKRQGDCITLVIPATVGCGKLLELPISQLENYVKEGN